MTWCTRIKDKGFLNGDIWIVHFRNKNIFGTQTGAYKLVCCVNEVAQQGFQLPKIANELFWGIKGVIIILNTFSWGLNINWDIVLFSAPAADA